MEGLVAGAKLIVVYPTPTDVAAFEQVYASEHVPMAGPIFRAAGATKAVLTKITGSPTGAPAFHRLVEVHFPSWAALQSAAASKPAQDALAHAHKISSGGPPLILLAEEEVVTF
jgi:uncharacterized protein (TIGR02118 family)